MPYSYENTRPILAQVTASLRQMPPASLLGRRLNLTTPEGVKAFTVTSQGPYSYRLEDMGGTLACTIAKPVLRQLLEAPAIAYTLPATTRLVATA